MAKRALAADDRMDLGDDDQRRDSCDEVIDEDGDTSPTHDHVPPPAAGSRLPPFGGRPVACTPLHRQRNARAKYHDIATPPAAAADPKSPRTRSDRRLADPPSAGVTLDDLIAAITYIRNETTVRLDEVAKTQVLQTAAIEEVARRTDRLEGPAGEQKTAAEALAARISALEVAGSLRPSC